MGGGIFDPRSKERGKDLRGKDLRGQRFEGKRGKFID